MLDIMRKYSGSLGAKIVLGLLALSFMAGFGLLASYQNTDVQQATIVAEVNDEVITQRELDQIYRRQVDRYRNILKDQFDEALLKKLNLRWQALNQRISNIVIMDEARKLGLSVSDQELMEEIMEYDAFKDENGKFRQSMYKAALENQRPPIAAATFEKEQRDMMLVRKMQSYVQDAVFVTDEEVLQYYVRRNQTVNIEYIELTADAMRSAKPVSDAAVEQFYSQNRDKFSTGKRVMLETLRVSPIRLESQITISEQEQREYFDSHVAEFSVKDDQVRASHILIKVDETAQAGQIQQAKSKIEDIKKRAISGTDFAELAQLHSQDGSAQQGGDLGWFGRGQMVKPFEEAAFGSEIGKIVGPVQTQFGFHLIKVTEKRTKGQGSFESVQTDVRRKLAANRAKQMASEAKAKADKMIASATPLTDVASTLGEGVTYSREEVGEQGFARMKYPKAVLDDILSDKYPPAGRWTTYQGVEYFMRVERQLEPQIEPLSKVRSRIEAILQQEDKMTQAAESALEALKDVQTGMEMQKAANRYNAKAGETGLFTLEADSVPNIGKSEEVMKTAFTLSKESPYAKTTLRVGEKFYVIKLKDRSELKFEEFETHREELRAELLKKARDGVWQNWLREAKGRAKVDIKNAPLPEDDGSGA